MKGHKCSVMHTQGLCLGDHLKGNNLICQWELADDLPKAEANYYY